MTCCESIDEWLELGPVPRYEVLSAIKLKMLITALVTTMGLTLVISRHDDWLLPLVHAAIDSRLASYLRSASVGGGSARDGSKIMKGGRPGDATFQPGNGSPLTEDTMNITLIASIDYLAGVQIADSPLSHAPPLRANFSQPWIFDMFPFPTPPSS